MTTILVPNEQIWIRDSPALTTLSATAPLTIVSRVQATGNRSPMESPPAAKKSLKIATATTGNGTGPVLHELHQTTTADQVTSGSPAASAAAASGKENRSILKPARPVTIRNELGGASVGGPRTRSWPGSLRKVSFGRNVDVVVYDRVCGDYVCSESQQLNTEPRDRKSFIGRTLLGRQQLPASIKCSNQATTTTATTSLPANRSNGASPASSSGYRPLPAAPSGSASTSAVLPPPQDNIDFVFFEDNAGQLRLKFTIPLGPGVAAGDALVKANVDGNKVRVLGTRTCDTERQEFSFRYALPMDVDPYALTARMDSFGNLYVEAPVMTVGRRRTVGAAEREQL